MFPTIVLIFVSLKWLKELSNAILWLSTYVLDRILSQKFRGKLFWKFWQKKRKELNELSEMYRKNSKYSKK